MNDIKIASIEDGGVSERERVTFKAVGIDNTGKYLALYSKERGLGQISSKPKLVYWFPDQQVKSGDFVILYTGNGVNTNFKNRIGTMTYVFYCGSSTTLFNTTQDSIALLRIETWDYKTRG